MPKKELAGITASDLIKQVQADDFVMPGDDALGELKKVLAHNDSQGGRHARGHISSDKARELLATWDYPCSRDKLKIVCQRLGRKSYLHEK